MKACEILKCSSFRNRNSEDRVHQSAEVITFDLRLLYYQSIIDCPTYVADSFLSLSLRALEKPMHKAQVHEKFTTIEERMLLEIINSRI